MHMTEMLSLIHICLLIHYCKVVVLIVKTNFISSKLIQLGHSLLKYGLFYNLNLMSMANCTMYITFWCIGQNISHNYYCCCCLSLRAFESDLCYIFITFCLLNSQNKAGAGITTWYDWLILVQEESLKTNIVLSKLLYMPYPFHVACNFQYVGFNG